MIRKDQAAGVAAGIAALLLALLRLEGVAWVVVILILAVVSRRMAGQFKLRPLLTCAVIVGVGYSMYYCWRYSYYGAALPNTAYAKAALDGPRLMRGVNYVFSFALTFLTPFLLAPLCISALQKIRIAIGLPVAAMAWAFSAYAVVVTGDFMAMGRFLIPGLAFAAILLAWMLVDLWGRSPIRRAATVVIASAIVTLGLLPGWDMHLVPESVRESFRFRHNAPRSRANTPNGSLRSAIPQGGRAWARRCVRTSHSVNLTPPLLHTSPAAWGLWAITRIFIFLIDTD